MAPVMGAEELADVGQEARREPRHHREGAREDSAARRGGQPDPVRVGQGTCQGTGEFGGGWAGGVGGEGGTGSEE